MKVCPQCHVLSCFISIGCCLLLFFTFSCISGRLHHVGCCVSLFASYAELCLWETGLYNGVHYVHKRKDCSLLYHGSNDTFNRMSEGVALSIYSLACDMGVLFNHVTLLVICPDSFLFWKISNTSKCCVAPEKGLPSLECGVSLCFQSVQENL